MLRGPPRDSETNQAGQRMERLSGADTEAVMADLQNRAQQ
jgi:hypothetical protein